mmetsp:Transcript_34586/g.75751  ORF Transcript_34586/g.75751 Transcript_34586/m.75751 type:complete len:217 (+) Transcript_34586:231-881(+)
MNRDTQPIGKGNISHSATHSLSRSSVACTTSPQLAIGIHNLAGLRAVSANQLTPLHPVKRLVESSDSGGIHKIQEAEAKIYLATVLNLEVKAGVLPLDMLVEQLSQTRLRETIRDIAYHDCSPSLPALQNGVHVDGIRSILFLIGTLVVLGRIQNSRAVKLEPRGRWKSTLWGRLCLRSRRHGIQPLPNAVLSQCRRRSHEGYQHNPPGVNHLQID